MDSYRTLYRIKVEHDYFDGKPCTALQCRLTPQGEALARRRGLLFRQTAENEWTVLFNREPDTGLDTLILALSITDTSFPLYTAWDDFRPSVDYELELPQKTETLEAATAIHASGRKRAIGSGFCTLHLRMTGEMLQAANSDTPMQTVLHFHAPKMRWEYLLISRNSEKLSASKIRLEEVAGKMEFTAFKDCEAYGRPCARGPREKSRCAFPTLAGCASRHRRKASPSACCSRKCRRPGLEPTWTRRKASSGKYVIIEFVIVNYMSN